MDISGGHYSDDNTGLIDDLLIKELGLKWGCGHADRGVRMNQACFVLEELADWGVGAHRQRMTIHCDKDCREVRIVQHQEECGARVELGGLHEIDLSVLSWRAKQFCTWREGRRTPGADRLSYAKTGRCEKDQ